ncbi:MAG TPA: alpha/beta hydrolase [Candidatus Omnitrophota bacterium]|nr:alpha/beta hydrolase [Candidatus Omnitrophota bacterium]HPD84340.1 alpha/beta hydrolase [Candidatus Omnitrophota bacterium]HRZ03198.1 alpha/beta hydrolase [Candidatus Omnitrophota bacterium]
MKILIVIVFSILAFVLFVRYFESRSVFYPTREIPVTPSAVGLDFDDVYFKTQDGVTLNGWFVKAGDGRCTLLYFHGNAGNLGHRLEKIALFHQLGVNIFIIDYRGYGKSTGKPTEQGVYQDALAAYDYLLADRGINPEKIVGYGDSLGGAVAIDLATKKKLSCLIIDSSFTSVADLGKMIFPFVPSFLLATKMDSINKVKGISIPKLFIHSVNDEIVPFALGKKLFDAAAQPKEFLTITGGHNTNHIDSKDDLLKGIGDFLKKYNYL